MAADSKAAVDFPESQRLLQQYDALSQHLQVVERQQLEQATLKSYWDQAMKLATKASEVGKNAGTDVQSLQDAKSLWQEAIDTFQQIPANSDYRDRVEEKIATSQKN
jgi:hypothetical protein